MNFKQLDPKVALKAIEGYQNELASEKQALDAFYRQFRCKRCKGELRRETHANHAFNDPNCLVPRSILRCLRCDFTFDPHSNLVLELGDPNKLLGVPLINNKD